ncbi:MAG: DoxX family protein [Pseudomonadota bacterium]
MWETSPSLPSQNAALFGARIALSAVFVIAGTSQLGDYTATQVYLETSGVTARLLPPAIALQIAFGLLLAAGLFSRISAGGLALFSLLAAWLFHMDLADPMQRVVFLKDLAIAGGLLAIVGTGPGEWSVDWARSVKLQADRARTSAMG